MKRIDTEELAVHIQREPAQGQEDAGKSGEAGLAQAHGNARGRT